MGGEQAASAAAGVNGGYLLFSGPVQLDERESQNRIAFTVWKAGTVVRLYVEHAGLQLTLSDTSSEHAQVISSGSTAMLRTLAPAPTASSWGMRQHTQGRPPSLCLQELSSPSW